MGTHPIFESDFDCLTEKMKLVAGSRKSELAMLQTNFVRDKLLQSCRETALEIEIEGIATVGDKILNIALSKIGEKSLFTKELEVALMQKKVQFVVHSLKDLPTTLPDGMVIAAILERESPLDAVVMKASLVEQGIVRIDQLGENALIGSSSLRRQAQLKRKFPKLRIESVRGNLNTRLRKLDEGEYSALILAEAGLKRMEKQNSTFVGRMTETLAPKDCLYAVGQGALAVEILTEDVETAKLLECLNHEESSLRVVAERAFMKTLMGGCSAPVAVESTLENETLTLKGAVFSLDGEKALFEEQNTNFAKKHKVAEYPADFIGILASTVAKEKMLSAQRLGEAVAQTLLDQGAKEILDEAKAQNAQSGPIPNPGQCPFPKAKELTKSLLS